MSSHISMVSINPRLRLWIMWSDYYSDDQYGQYTQQHHPAECVQHTETIWPDSQHTDGPVGIVQLDVHPLLRQTHQLSNHLNPTGKLHKMS